MLGVAGTQGASYLHSLPLVYCALKRTFQGKFYLVQLGLQVHYRHSHHLSHTSIPVSKGMTAPADITRFEGVSQKKEGAKMKQYISSIVEKEAPSGKQLCRHMGLVCPLDRKEELSGGNGSLGDCLAVGRGEGDHRREGGRVWPAHSFISV